MTPQEQENSENTIPETPVSDSDQLEKELAAAREQAATNLAGWQRVQADFANYRRRAEQEKLEMTKYANSRLMLCLLPILDDLDRALAQVPPDLEDDQWVAGLKLIWKKFRTILEQQGLTEIKAIGQDFDPRIHEAVASGKGPEDIVVAEAQKGYMLHDQILRPTKVMVGDGQAEKEDSNG